MRGEQSTAIDQFLKSRCRLYSANTEVRKEVKRVARARARYAVLATPYVIKYLWR